MNTELSDKEADLSPIESNKLADLVAVKDNSAIYITELQRVKSMMIAKKVVKQE